MEEIEIVMDYEKKYNEALKDMRAIYPNLKGDAKLAAEHAFPELAESEDERMCTRCIELLRKVSAYSGEEYLGVEIVDCIIGLQALRKKQKEPHIPWYDLQKSKEAGYTILKTEEYEELIKQKEQQEVDLEEAYKEFCKDYPFPWSSQYVNREYIDELCLSVARHFYELGQSQMPMPEDTVLFQKGVAEGRRLEREDLALTWEDMLTIDVFLNNVREEKCTKKLGEYYREVLKRFNEAKEKEI